MTTITTLDDFIWQIRTCDDFIRDFSEALRWVKSPHRERELSDKIYYYQGKREGLQYAYNALWGAIKKEDAA